MSTALIGHSGFVGGALLRQTSFDDLYRSTNIEDIAGRSYDQVVSAGVSSLKWKANKDPVADRQGIQRLIDALGGLKTDRFILISTIDVYGSPIDVDEDSALQPDEMMPYGRHRWELEQFVRERFDTVIIRLPNLFGTGLRKNLIYDLLHDHQVDKIHQDAVLQWYSVDGLWADIERTVANDLRLVNIATEPWRTGDLVEAVFGSRLPVQHPPPAPRYDFHTKHAGLWGKTGPYIYAKDQIRDQLAQFIARERKAGTP